MPTSIDDRLAAARTWLLERGDSAFAFQEQMWRAHWAGASGLLQAPTGSGKTLAAWLGPVLAPDEHESEPGIRVLWLTPLRALARDLVLALRTPLAQLRPQWRVDLRTSDTTAAARARQQRTPPHALVTTPESLSVMLSQPHAAAAFARLNTVIVDEWHEFLGSKRGVQLELALASLKALAPGLHIWGMSATVPDLQEAMQTLLGPAVAGQLLQAPDDKHYVIDSVLPDDIERFPWAGHLGLKLLPKVLARIAEARSTLLFTNTRSQAEIWYRAIVEARIDWLTQVGIHHGSIDAATRRAVEEKVKAGELRCVVCTSSLDLGVDFPPVDQVLQIGSPKSIARLMQRAGRSGHQPGSTSRLTLVPTNTWELAEAAAARRSIAARRVEPRHGLILPLDVLAQHLVTLACGGGFDADAVYAQITATHAFAKLTSRQWQWTLDFISRGGAALHGYPEFRRVTRRDGRWVIAGDDLARRHRRAIGTITSDATISVNWLTGGRLGDIEESFLSRLAPGASFVFAGRLLTLVRVRDSRAYVRTARHKSGAIPRWLGARMPLSEQLGDALLEQFRLYGEGGSLDPEVRILAPLLELQRRWSALPAPSVLLVEQFHSREGWHLFIYPFAGRLVNEGIATLAASRATRAMPRTISVTANEYGFELLSPDPFPAEPTLLRRYLSPEDLLQDLLASVDGSELARRQFRDIARIAGLVDPGMPRRGKSARQLQMSTGLMFDVLTRYDPDNELLTQSRREVLEAQLAYTELHHHLVRLEAQQWRVLPIRRLTPLAFPLWSERLQSQTLSSETFRARIERTLRGLERAAS